MAGGRFQEPARNIGASILCDRCLVLDLPKLFYRCATPASLNICDKRPHFKDHRTPVKDVPIPQVPANDTPGTKNFLDI